MRENSVERALVQKGKERGIEFIKFKSPSRKDLPDRIAFLPRGVTVFVECKRPGETLRPSQIRYSVELIGLGHYFFSIDNTQDIGILLDEIQALSN